jgi:hypothetical protein
MYLDVYLSCIAALVRCSDLDRGRTLIAE